jgi:hypothetical protein
MLHGDLIDVEELLGVRMGLMYHTRLRGVRGDFVNFSRGDVVNSDLTLRTSSKLDCPCGRQRLYIPQEVCHKRTHAFDPRVPIA